MSDQLKNSSDIPESPLELRFSENSVTEKKTSVTKGDKIDELTVKKDDALILNRIKRESTASPIWGIKEWFTSREAAVYMGTTPGSIRNQVYRGQLTPYKRLGRLYFKKSELDRQIQSPKKGEL
jgi:hypothetical protein